MLHLEKVFELTEHTVASSNVSETTAFIHELCIILMVNVCTTIMVSQIRLDVP